MKTIFNSFLLLILFTGIDVNAQDVGNDEVFTMVEQMPEFNGVLHQWLAENITYPAKSRKKNEQGKTVLQLTITKTGSVTDVVLVKSSGYKLIDEEAVRVVKTMPAWKPGKQNGNPVNVRYTLPIVFKLN